MKTTSGKDLPVDRNGEGNEGECPKTSTGPNGGSVPETGTGFAAPNVPFAHTPGRWFADQSGNVFAMVNNEQTFLAEVSERMMRSPDYRLKQEALANAQLMAAGTMLLDLVKLVEKKVAARMPELFHELTTAEVTFTGEQLAIIRAAIAKATTGK